MIDTILQILWDTFGLLTLITGVITMGLVSLFLIAVLFILARGFVRMLMRKE